MDQVVIEKSYFSLIWFALWSWILLFIPLLVRFLNIYTRKYTYDNKNLYVREGVLNKNSISIPLIKIESVRSTSNIIGNGTITIGTNTRGANTAGMQSLNFISKVEQQRNKLSNTIDKIKEESNIKVVDIF